MLFEEAMKRYSTIDGELFDYNFSYPDQAYLEIKFYPWWEHPKLKYAITNNLDWQVNSGEEIIMKIVPVNLIKVSLDYRLSATEIDFSLDDPLLWQYYERVKLYVNENTDLSFLRKELIAKIPTIETCISDYLPETAKYEAPYCLGDFPVNIFNTLIQILKEAEISCFPKEEIEFNDRIKLIYFDDNNYLIAEDFIIEVPEVIHRDEDVIIREK